MKQRKKYETCDSGLPDTDAIVTGAYAAGVVILWLECGSLAAACLLAPVIAIPIGIVMFIFWLVMYCVQQ